MRKGHAWRCASACVARSTAGQAEGAAADVASTKAQGTRASGHSAHGDKCENATQRRSAAQRSEAATRLLRARRGGRAAAARGSRRRRRRGLRSVSLPPQTATDTHARVVSATQRRMQVCCGAPGRRCAVRRHAALAARPAQRPARFCRVPRRRRARSRATGRRPCRGRWAWRGRRRRRRGRSGRAAALLREKQTDVSGTAQAVCSHRQRRTVQHIRAQRAQQRLRRLRGAASAQRRTTKPAPRSRLRHEHRRRPRPRARKVQRSVTQLRACGIHRLCARALSKAQASAIRTRKRAAGFVRSRLQAAPAQRVGVRGVCVRHLGMLRRAATRSASAAKCKHGVACAARKRSRAAQRAWALRTHAVLRACHLRLMRCSTEREGKGARVSQRR